MAPLNEMLSESTFFYCHLLEMTENGNLPNTMSSFSVWSTVKTQFQNIKASIVKYAKKETLDRIYNLVIERMSCGVSCLSRTVFR